MNKIIELNAETGKQIVRDMTQDELANYESEKQQYLSDLQKYNEQKEAEKAAKAALLEKLGITEEEAKLLLS